MSYSYSGVIRYTSQQQGRLGQARGREQFVITLNDDGSRSLRSHVIIQDPPMVERDVVLSVDASFHPRSAQVRIRVGDDREGQALFICDGHRIHGSGRTVGGGGSATFPLVPWIIVVHLGRVWWFMSRSSISFFSVRRASRLKPDNLLPCISVTETPLLTPKAVIKREVILGIMYGPRPTATLLCCERRSMGTCKPDTSSRRLLRAPRARCLSGIRT